MRLVCLDVHVFSFSFMLKTKGGREDSTATHFLVDCADFATASVESPLVYDSML